jgi:hypothetical protein
MTRAGRMLHIPDRSCACYSRTKLRIRPTRHTCWLSHSGGLGVLIDALTHDGQTTTWFAELFLGSPPETCSRNLTHLHQVSFIMHG